ncbi:MAG: hypothetical protein ABIQ73_00015 [Acidimicrobiales bacterium]
MLQALKQAWWAPVAALLVVGQLVLAVVTLFADDDADTKAVAFAIALTGALVLAAGLWYRLRTRGLGNALIIVGALFGAFWFWSLVLPVLAIIVVVGVVISEARTRARTAEAP